MFKIPTFFEVFSEAVDFREPAVRSTHNLIARYKRVCENHNEGGAAMVNLVERYQRRRIPFRPLEPAGADIGALPFDRAFNVLWSRVEAAISRLSDDLTKAGVCQIEWLSERTCRFVYDELSTRRGILNHRTTRHTHTHDLVRAKVYRLPAREIPMPPVAREIIRSMPPTLARAARVVAGTLIMKDSAQSAEYVEPTLLKRALDRSMDFISSGVEIAADAVTNVLENLDRPAPRQTFKKDPAIIAGQFCFYGWEL
jgi:hypothetical protein